MTERRGTKKKKKFKRILDNKFEMDSDSDPEYVDIIAKDKREADLLSPEQTEILRSMEISLRHDVPQQHQVERRAGSRVPSAKEKEEFRKLVPNMKKGTFTSKEDSILVKNWEEFCKMHDWDPKNPKPFLFLRHHYHFYLPKADERKKFVQFLADGLPKRSLYSVYHRFRNLYEPHKIAKYSYKEDQYIIKHIEQNKRADDSRKFADLAKVLNRTRASVWRRYRLLKKKRESAENTDKID